MLKRSMMDLSFYRDRYTSMLMVFIVLLNWNVGLFWNDLSSVAAALDIQPVNTELLEDLPKLEPEREDNVIGTYIVLLTDDSEDDGGYRRKLDGHHLRHSHQSQQNWKPRKVGVASPSRNSQTTTARNRRLSKDEKMKKRRRLEQHDVDFLAEHAPGAVLVYSYVHTLRGLAARMTNEQAQKISAMTNVISVIPDKVLFDIPSHRDSHDDIRVSGDDDDDGSNYDNNRRLQRDSKYQRHLSIHRRVTDNTPEFIGLTEKGELWSKGIVGEDVVIGVIDGGIHPEHVSFADVPTPKNGNTGSYIPYRRPPKTFTGTGCAFGNTDYDPNDLPFTCNNKLLAAKCYATYFSVEVNSSFLCGGDGKLLVDKSGNNEVFYLSARAESNHGTHVAATAAGNYGVQTTVVTETEDGTEQESNITLSGIAPRARISQYKVCWGVDVGCAMADVAKAIDDAVDDGVDVINLSLGSRDPNIQLHHIALLNAVRQGIVGVSSAGNVGPLPDTISAGWHPWSVSVGSMLDDSVVTSVLVIEEPESVAGTYESAVAQCEACNQQRFESLPSMEIVPAEPLDACDTIANDTMEGKIALVIRGTCFFSDKFNNVAAAGARAIVVYNDGAAPDRIDPLIMAAENTTIPGVMINFNIGDLLYKTYMQEQQQNPTNPIFASLRVDSVGNIIAPFSSRGPAVLFPGIIGPDVVAPGVNILAAGIPDITSPLPNNSTEGEGNISQIPNYNSTFAALSGTSMASPHVAGVMALLKQAHPFWSPAALRSALMTTARQNIQKAMGGALANPFDVGSGMIQPNEALDPGLVFETQYNDYIAFLCGTTSNVIGQEVCDDLSQRGYSFDSAVLNYPSIAVDSLLQTRTIYRTVTNVGDYFRWPLLFRANVVPPSGITVKVEPSEFILACGESLTFAVTFTTTDMVSWDEWLFGSLTWIGEETKKKKNKSWYADHPEKEFSVYMPIAVKPVRLDFPYTHSVDGESGASSYKITPKAGAMVTATVHGPEQAFTLPVMISQDEQIPLLITFPTGMVYARFALFDEFTSGQGKDDLDMTLRIRSAGSEGAFRTISEALGPTSDEFVEYISLTGVTEPIEALITIEGSRLANSNYTDFVLFYWSFGVDDDRGLMTVEVAEADSGLEPVQPRSVELSWSNLTSNTIYYGGVSYKMDNSEDTVGVTIIDINT